VEKKAGNEEKDPISGEQGGGVEDGQNPNTAWVPPATRKVSAKARRKKRNLRGR